MELSLAPGYAAQLARRLNLVTSLRAAAAIVHLNDVIAVDGIEGEKATWSARAAVELRLEAKLSRVFAIYFAPEAGVVLRRIPALGRERDFERLGGLWLGGALGVAFDAPAQRNQPEMIVGSAPR
jgi:hypothetical protein